MTHLDGHLQTNGFDAVEWLTNARERGVDIKFESGHLNVGLGSASWRDWLTFAALAEDHEDEILQALPASN